jgi:acyl-CoA thioester hydrolase
MNDPPLPSELAKQPVVITLPVQWGNQDLFGHVNGVVYFRWVESARVEYLNRIGLGHLLSSQRIGPILASVKCDYRRQLKHPDTLHVSASITEMGRTSMKMSHLIYSTAQQAIAAQGESIIVIFDYANQRPVPVPDAIRAKVDSLERRT